MKTLTAFYDLDVGPVSYDFVVFLVKAELERRRVGADNLHVVIVPGVGPGGMRDKSSFYDQHEGKFRLWNICIPACALIGATVTLATDWEQAEKMVRLYSGVAEGTSAVWPPDWNCQTLRTRPHLIGGVIEAAKSGAPIPRLQASEHARRTVRALWKGKRVVTMTLRNTYLHARNTDGKAWSAARLKLVDEGYVVWTIHDVGAALKQGYGLAELSIDLRMAMYQEADMNLVANCGPASLCWFSEKPYIMLDAGVGETEQEWRGLFVDQGLPWGETWPWATPKQRIVYERSTADVIMREVKRGLG